ncbi:MAG: DUF4255 domain-containing protein [Candidatus Bathyarchaeota archaeon]|nr:DUF4255 domain-containing protein [Candidatus Bathyarchaeota archaeon]
MSDYAFVVDMDRALTDFIWEQLKNDAAAKSVITSKTQIAVTSPKDAPASKKLLLFLYSITPQATPKNTPAKANPEGASIAQVPFVLRYLVVPCTGSEEKDHLLLGKLIQAALANPVVSGDEAGKAGFVLRLDLLGLDELSRLWGALDAPFRLSASVMVSTELNCQVPPEAQSGMVVPVAAVAVAGQVAGDSQVWGLYEGVFRTFTEQTSDWKKRNLIHRQWLMQDFKKNTQMGVEEMLSALDGLGNKLELNLAAASYVEPLEALASYYEHQRTEIQGLGKISQKQRENVEKISQWIEQVKALIEAIR